MKIDKILQIHYPYGYLAFMAASRSGHNFIKFNVFSWLGETEVPKWKYVNLENMTSVRFEEDLNKRNINLADYPKSIFLLNVRSLMNWYTSFFFFFNRAYQNKMNKVSPDFLDKKIFMTLDHFNEQLKRNPKFNENPHIVALDGITKEEYIQMQTTFPLAHKDRTEKALNAWLSNAREVKGETNYLPQFTKIYYDEFVVSREYRMKICREIGGTYNENVLNKVAAGGGGSTFDKKFFDGRASQMKVLERWKIWGNSHREYLELLRGHEALDYYIDNFDVTAEEKQFIKSI